MTVLEAVKEYQVPGCCGDFDETNFAQQDPGVGWSDHNTGTFVVPIGSIFLGMPTGFCRLGPIRSQRILIFESARQQSEQFPYNMFNVPCWKYMDEHGNTLVRGLSPRTNFPFLHVILGDARSQINCLEITAKDIQEMD